MGVCLATDIRILQVKDDYYIASQVYSILKRYFDEFGKLTLCTRMIEKDCVLETYMKCTEMIETLIGTQSLLKSALPSYKKRLEKAVKSSDLVIVRCPGRISYLAADYARRYKVPYLTELMGCAWDAYWNHSFQGKLLAPYMFLKMKSVVKKADYSIYVTNEFLQKRYPCVKENIGISNVVIKEHNQEILKRRLEKIETMDTTNLMLMTTAAVDVRYKGQEYVIKAISQLNQLGIRIKYWLVGGGNPKYLKSVAKKCGVENQVEFLGRKSLEEVFALLDTADIYLQPSLQEGLPRSMIEALSRGCACIGANTAGIPELIPHKWVVKRKSSKDIVKRIYEYAKSTPEDKKNIATVNFEKSKEYLDDILTTRRNAYYKKIKNDMRL